VIAYIEGGINWHQSDAAELADRVFLNKGELPPPTTPAKGRKVCAAGALCAADYSDTPDANHNGIVDPEDIIKRFSNGRDDDHNGFVDDISGWDFYDHQNDPATVDSTYDHANGQMEQAAAQTNNGIGTAGVCPNCMLMPIKAGAEADIDCSTRRSNSSSSVAQALLLIPLAIAIAMRSVCAAAGVGCAPVIW